MHQATADTSVQGIHALLNQCPKLTPLSLTGVQAFYLREDLINYCREAPPGEVVHYLIFVLYTNYRPEFTEHQRHVFCVFSGDGVNKLRTYLNEIGPDIVYDTEGTMYDDREGDDMDTDQHLPGLMHATGINDDDDDMDEVDGGDGSQYELEGEG